MKSELLFISQDAFRMSAPIVFPNFLLGFKFNTNIPFQVLLGRGG